MALNANPETLTRYIIQQEKVTHGTGELTQVLQSIQLACKTISSAVRRAGMQNLFGLAGSSNASGDDVKKLDILSNDIFINSLTWSERVYGMVSEENPEAIMLPGAQHGKYAVVFDPLDGSSNIDASVSVGTIFGIYPRKEGDVSDMLRPGKEMCAAGYCMYGSSTVLVLTTGNGVNGFTLDTEIGEFVLTHPNIRIPDNGGKTIYSVNEGNQKFWDPVVQDFVKDMKNPADGSKPYSLRYIGSMVADVHRTLLYGGIFMYPGDSNSPKGKLRLLYECFPMAFLTEQAGGQATSGTDRVLDLAPSSDIHGRLPIFLGSKRDVEEIIKRKKAAESQ
eukprot:TRINITY_DN1970_c0_g1_i1.p1 TRINITY_DN1970_c0_g1~~TRINITY_DN1970_c0_g1_i1.p1  ORF type:complete len:348 (-),score=101.79 TRINITY_DN1970_c0_g1_i1:62-1066(-)